MSALPEEVLDTGKVLLVYQDPFPEFGSFTQPLSVKQISNDHVDSLGSPCMPSEIFPRTLYLINHLAHDSVSSKLPTCDFFLASLKHCR